MDTAVTYEKWVWTELLAFDVEQPDLSVQDYLDTVGVVPDVISLLISAADFVITHEGFVPDVVLPPDYCSRDGHEGNEIRRRQVWTSSQLKELIGRLRRAGAKVFLSGFVHYLNNEFHHEWLSDHPEAMQVHASRGRVDALNVLARLADGTSLPDHFATRLARVCQDYGFDGWQGADGYGPLNDPIYVTDMSDDTIDLFANSGDHDLPDVVLAPSHDKPENLTKRIDWIWRHRRLEWIVFWTDRWANFYRAVTDAMHATGCEVFVNSAWTRDPFEAIYRFGVDYRKLVDAGIDGIMVESVAGGLVLMDDRRDFHYDQLAMLMHIKAYVPDIRLVCLQGTKDVLEDWDVLHHGPTLLEREIYSTNNVYHTKSQGELERCANGFFVCLGDGIPRHEWDWLRKQWDFAFHNKPQRLLGATLVWSDAALHNNLVEFPQTRDWCSHRMIHELLSRHCPIQTTVRINDINKAHGPLLVVNPHLWPQDERQRLLGSEKPIVAIGPQADDWPEASLRFVDSIGPSPIQCGLYNAECRHDYTSADVIAGADKPLLDDPWSIIEPLHFRQPLPYRPISDAFLVACSALVRKMSINFTIDTELILSISDAQAVVGMMVMEMSPGVLRLAIRNTTSTYGRPRIDLRRPIAAVKVRTAFPVTTVKPKDGRFHVVVPPRGIVVADVYTDANTGEST